MVFQTDIHIQCARDHVESGDTHRLPYACLELRFALERITYQKLQLRLDKITIEEIGAWQPRRAMDRLMELVDEHLTRDATIQIAQESEYGKAPDSGFVRLGENKGVSPRELGKHWQKLGSFLHIQMPKKKGDRARTLDEKAIRVYIEEMIEYIEEVTSTRFDFHFSHNVTFECGKCGHSIVRNRKLLKEKSTVQCQNPQCNAPYITHIDDGEYRFEAYQVSLGCRRCGQTVYVDANVFLGMRTDDGRVFACDKCGSRHLVRWLLKYTLEEEAEK